jgi:hypothetical protein
MKRLQIGQRGCLLGFIGDIVDRMAAGDHAQDDDTWFLTVWPSGCTRCWRPIRTLAWDDPGVPLSPLPDGPKTFLASDSDSSLTVVAVG